MSFQSGYIAIVGWPNVGKSTFLNAVLGVKLSIVSPWPQTTREKILGILNKPTSQMIFIDTPGWLDPRDEYQKTFKRDIVRSIHDDADVLIWLLEPRPLREDDIRFGELLVKTGKPLLVAINKVDSNNSPAVLEQIVAELKLKVRADLVPHFISSRQGRGLPELIASAEAILPEGQPFFPTDQVTDKWERFYAAELIREQIFLRYQDEVPHASLVQVEDFIEKTDRKDVIRATITVETEGQKRILIGEKGRAIRDLGQRARAEIEKQIGRPVFLELVVKIHPRWRKDARFLKDLETRVS